MKQNTKAITLIIITTIVLSIIFLYHQSKKTPPTRFVVGILQTASHPALDDACEGFKEQLKQELKNDVTFIERNAQGSITQAHTIAEHFHTDSAINAIYAIATPALQAIAAVEKSKPIIIAAVTNPASLGILEEQSNICGVTDMFDVDQEIKALSLLLPDVKTVAILFNPAEQNSVEQVTAMIMSLKKENITALRFGTSTESDIPAAVDNALGKADALLIPTDNMLVSAMPLIVAHANKANKPVIASDNPSAERGALMTRGVNYTDNGKQAALVAAKILLENKKPDQLGITNTSSALVINQQQRDMLKISIPDSLTNQVLFVKTK